MFQCTNCMETFQSEEELSLIVEVTERDESGSWHTTDRYPLIMGEPPAVSDNLTFEVFRGCPYCLEDNYLKNIALSEGAREV